MKNKRIMKTNRIILILLIALFGCGNETHKPIECPKSELPDNWIGTYTDTVVVTWSDSIMDKIESISFDTIIVNNDTNKLIMIKMFESEDSILYKHYRVFHNCDEYTRVYFNFFNEEKKITFKKVDNER